ncbi:MAG TPA: hypothetical protein VII72_05425 [Myxococcota bacterium]
MSGALRLALALLACAATARADVAVPARLAPWLDASRDQLVRRAYVPSPERRVGEVRILRRGDATVVQTLLYSKVLSRVVAEIRKKERANWPGNPDAAAYLAALERVQKTIWGRLPADQRAADRRQKLWIEFVLAPGAGFIAIGAFEMEEPGGEVRVLRREPIEILEPSRDYLGRNQRLIAADSFHAEDGASLLGSEARK